MELLAAIPERTLSEKEFLKNLGKKDLFAVMLCIYLLIEDEKILERFRKEVADLFDSFESEGFETISDRGDVFNTLKIPRDYEFRLLNLHVEKYGVPSI
ncbi:hypothetical protein [Dolosicoccus paucivorans]|uniref:Uncharacterized protein n=1 Tax=Dolosicoccus paucivorans TaxID=84521 RepID=A0A2N6SLP5_9LACT|nr:hypothetical protein [Dolosicoccus paucivorans]PMB83841.1 hypothetical protein CJ206_06965 [Dolosicoccus paucivorans]PMC57985.1 hypothetical protein CJ205_06695 [Dolosicoccus paucivorans]